MVAPYPAPVANVPHASPEPPPATGFEGRVTPLGRRAASPAAVDRRRANRHARKVVDRVARVRTGATRELIAAAEPEGPEDPYKFDTILWPMIVPVACSGPWVDAVEAALSARRPNGKPVVPYAVKPPRKAVDAEGDTTWNVALSTTPAKLLELLAEHGVYPPTADDPASQMRPCGCPLCVSDGGRRAVLYPAQYVTLRGTSYECRIARQTPDVDVLAELDPDAAYLLALSRVRERNVQAYDDNPASGRRQPQRIADRRDAMAPADDAWRHKHLGVLGIESRTAVDALKAHRWTHVGGTVKARLVKRGLTRVGDLHDFLNLYGRSLGEVAGLTSGMGAGVREKLAGYVSEWGI